MRHQEDQCIALVPSRPPGFSNVVGQAPSSPVLVSVDQNWHFIENRSSGSNSGTRVAESALPSSNSVRGPSSNRFAVLSPPGHEEQFFGPGYETHGPSAMSEPISSEANSFPAG
ncbi:hypothetical protein FRX31_018935 [Thalictrum thalictroides]|uniref:Uncharacterized protein n=1 Tax=Thalictrum thalictroides TaxID=46969 RepID=A0A7J6W3F4_THATH|nr:hypothetical protein FRX31_018935 [Thalictrum thalictroides]